jgi:hypothetical protein
VFIHIAAAPPKPVYESEMPIEVMVEEVLLSQTDNILEQISNSQHQPLKFKAQLIDIARCKAHQLSSVYTYMSHGIPFHNFLEQQKFSYDSDLAIYIYQKTTT